MRRLLVSLLFCVLCGFATLPIFAQSASISGYVRDASTGETLLQASVVIAGTTNGVIANNSGYYTLAGLAPGAYTFTASFVGYVSLSRETTLAPGQDLQLDFDLQPIGVELGEVLITAENEEEEERTQVGVTRMPVRMVTQMPAVLQADVFRSLQLLPGIKAASDYSSGLYIRGGSPDQTMILLDRTTVYNPTHVFGFFSTFNPDALKDVQVYKGGYPAQYGGRLGSVVDIYNKDGNREELDGTLTLGLLASRAAVEGPYSKGSWMLAVRRSTVEPLLAALRQSVEGIPETFYFYDVNGKVNYDASASDKFSLSVYGGTDNLYIVPSTDLDVEMIYGNRTGSLNWTHLFSPQLFSNFTFTGSKYFSLPVFDFAGTEFSRKNYLYDFSAKGDLQYVPNGRHSLEAGFWAGNMTLKLSDTFDNQESFSSRIRTQYGSFYLQDTWRPSQSWMVRGGLRANYFTEGNFLRLEPRVSVENRQSDRLRFQAAYGRYYQFLTLITNEAFSGLDVWLTTADGVPPSWGDQFVFGVKTAPWEGYRVDAEVYYRTMEDLFELDPNLQDPSGLAYEDLFRFGQGYAYGVELMLEKSAGRINGMAGYTWGSTRRRFPEYNQGGYYPPKYDRIHDLSLILNYDFASRWRANATFVYATGQAYTRALGRTEYEDPFGSVPYDDIVNGRVNASRLPDYHRLDVGVTKLGRFFGLADYELQIQVINLYNRRNVWFYTYDFDDTPPQETVRMLPILPNLSLTLNF
jgi:hypothetical protein